MRFPALAELLRAPDPLLLIQRHENEDDQSFYWQLGEWFVPLFKGADERTKILKSANPWLEEFSAGDGLFVKSLASLSDDANNNTYTLLEYIEQKACSTVFHNVMWEIITEKKLGDLTPITFRRVLGQYLGIDVVGREVYEVFVGWHQGYTPGHWDEICNAVRKYCLLAGCPTATSNPLKNVDALRELIVGASSANRETLLHTQIDRLLNQAQAAQAKYEQKETALTERVKQLEDDARATDETGRREGALQIQVEGLQNQIAALERSSSDRQRALQAQVEHRDDQIATSAKDFRTREAEHQAQVKSLQDELKTFRGDSTRIQNELNEANDKLGRQNRIITDLSYRYVLESLAGPSAPGQATTTWRNFWNHALCNATQTTSTSPLSDMIKKKFAITTVCANLSVLAGTKDLKLKSLRDAGLNMYGTLSTDIHNYVQDYPEKYKVDPHRWGVMDGAVLEALAPDPNNIDAKGNVDWTVERARY